MARDVLIDEIARSNGELVRSTYVDVVNSEVVLRLDLERVEPGDWVVSGMLQQKPIEHRLAGTGAMLSWLGDALAMRAAIETHGVGARLDLAAWAPTRDPTRRLDVKIVIRERVDAERYAADMTLQGTESAMVLDRFGSVSIWLEEEGIETRVEWIFSRGTF